MNKFKKLASMVIALSIMLSCLVIYSQPASAAKDYSNQIEFLTALGVEGFTVDGAAQTVTRGAFAKALSEALGIKQEEPNSIKYFEDVAEDNEYFKYVSFLAGKGIIQGYETGMFQPENNLAYNEALKMALMSLGYDVYAQAKGGYYVGYIQTADSIKLSFAVEDVNGMNRGEVANLLYKMLDSRYVTTNISGENFLEYKESDELLIKKIFDLEEHTGVVTAIKAGTIYGAGVNEENEIMIDYKRYRTSAKKLINYLGVKVKYYANEDDEIVYLENDRKVNIISASYDDIEDKTTAQNIILSTDNRTKTYNVNKNAFYVYNGEPLLAPTDEDVKPGYGDIKLIDNDGDNKIDVVIIWSYKSYVIKKATQLRVNFKDNPDNFQYVKLDDNDVTTSVIYGNSYMDTNLLDSGNVITYAESKDKKRITLFVYAGEIEGKLTGWSKLSNTATVDGEEYKVMPGTDLSGVQGKNSTLYVDKNMSIVDYLKYDEERIGLMTSMKYNSDDEELYIKIVSETSGEATKYTIPDGSKIKFGIGNDKNSKKMQPKDLYVKVKGEDESIPKQLVMYTLTQDGESIASLTVPESTADTLPKNEEEEDKLRLSYTYTTNNPNARYYRCQLETPDDENKSYLDVVYTKTKFVTIAEDDKDCSFDSVADFCGSSDSMNFASFKAYNKMMTGWYKYIVIEADSSSSSSADYTVGTLTTSMKPMIVTDSVLEWDETKEEIVSRVTGYTVNDSSPYGKSETLVNHYDNELKNSEFKPISQKARGSRYAEGTIGFTELKQGDVIIYDTHAMSGKVNVWAMLCKAEDLKTDYSNNDFNSASARMIINGRIAVIAEEGIRMATSGYSGGTPSEDYSGIISPNVSDANEIMIFRGWSEYNGFFGAVVKYNTQNNKAELVSWDDMNVGDRVITYRNGTWQHTRGFYVIVE